MKQKIKEKVLELIIPDDTEIDEKLTPISDVKKAIDLTIQLKDKQYEKKIKELENEIRELNWLLYQIFEKG